MKPASYWIDRLDLRPHPEGGFYKETYRSSESVELKGEIHGQRNFSTAIYFLLRAGDKSHFHKIKSDEIWHFHDGGQLTIFMLGENLKNYTLGTDLEGGDQPQLVIPAHHWFGAIVSKGSYVLASCTVSPGFDFEDFQLASRGTLLAKHPDEAEIINMLT